MDPTGNDISRRVYALSEITESITRMFEKYYNTPYWIKAEISALNLYPTSGHCFPLMVEKSDGKVKAQLKAIIWKDDLFYITRKFEEVTRETFREGLNILFYAYIKFSSTYGLSLQIIDIEPLFTLGEMARDKMNSIMTLKREGVFERNRQLQLPVLLKRVAIISVASSKGYNDLMVTLKDNKPGYRVLCELFPAVLQGKGAVESIIKQLLVIKQMVTKFDAAVIVRGGGDDVGLSCYDHVELAREVAMFPIPVITGIGHSTNETVVEMVACANKITPTDVAHFILSGFYEQDKRLGILQMDMKRFLRDLTENDKMLLRDYGERIAGLSMAYVIEQRFALKSVAEKFTHGATYKIHNRQAELNKLALAVSSHPARILSSESTFLNNQGHLLLIKARHTVSLNKQHLIDKGNRLHLLNPENVMKRGYAIVRIAGKVPALLDDIEATKEMDIEMYKWNITGRIEEVRVKQKEKERE